MKNLKIYIMIMCVMISWGFNVAVLKILVSHAKPVTITSLRIFTAGVTVFIILSFLKIVRKPTRAELKYIILGGLLNVVSHHYFLSTGLSYTSATNGGLILGAGPLLTAILSTVILRRMPTFIRSMGFLFGSVGVLLTVLSGGKGFSDLSIGDLFVFISIMSQALSFILISKAAKTLDPRLLTGYMLVFGSVILFMISLVQEPGALKEIPNLSFNIWLAFLGSAIIATALGHMLYNYSIGKIGPTEASIFLNFNTFFSLVGSAVLLGEKITPHHLWGLLFIVSGVLFGSGTIEEFLQRKRHAQYRNL
ncbi:DMT family transporter [Neobacillus terrae]|uniref:DMT family transporter n=1 Tax=Neobacillus terrae TaxID=3034837 RepID=UPI00140A264A|nr:DMT family transporter [Neobacillus terrae]NHM31653.1 DMT family transporter [Neobacillus terrae]